MESWKIFGHSAIKSILSKQLETEKFSHAYLWQGPSGVGKKMLALEFAQKVLRTENITRHPDFHLLDEDLSVENVREFVSQLYFKPTAAKWKLAIISNAENLNIQSSNALLKTLEEPPRKVILILITNRPLLPTITSRCQVFNFNVFSSQQLLEFAQAARIKSTQDMLTLSFGLPGRLKQLAGNAELFLEQQKSIQTFRTVSMASPGRRLMNITEFSDLESEQLQDLFSVWLSWQTAELKTKPEYFTRVQKLLDALEGIKINKNKKLILQGLFLNI